MEDHDVPRDTRKIVYEARYSDGVIFGAIHARDWDRFRQTLRFIPKDASSLLDAGCDRGHWLHYVSTHRKLSKHLGVDISEPRIAEARQNYPDLNLEVCFLEDMDLKESSYDVVTSLEVLEHIPDWIAVLEALLRIAARRVVVTVPYKESIVKTVCIHCGKLTPLYGHLRAYDESSFPPRPGWRLSFGHVKTTGIGQGPIRRVYRTLFPLKSWLVACYDKT